MGINVQYEPDGEILARFMQSLAFVRGIRGPIGSGKSVACVIEMLRLALGQERSPDLSKGETLETPLSERTGKRKVRQVVVRNTSPQLETTTMKTWLEWLPEEDFGKVRWRPPFRQDIEIPELDLEWQVYFLALDREEDVKKLLSFEFTHGWANEARELNRAIITAMISRLSRYPRKIEGGATRPCMIMDTNAPDPEHWWSIMSGETEPPDWMSEEDRQTLIKPSNWQFFNQPPGVLDVMGPDGSLTGYRLNPDRENGKYTDEDYYTRLMQGQTRDWIRNMLQNKIGSIFGGRPVYRDFNEQVHVAREPFGPEPGTPIHVGVDFGLTPAAAFGQDVRGQVRMFDELVTRDMTAVRFAEILVRHCAENYPDFDIVFTGDPAGDERAQTDGKTPFQIFEAAGIKIQPAWTNEPDIRIGAVQTQINTLVDGGRAGYLLSPSCTYLRAAKNGGYCYKKDREEIDKGSIYSHISDAEQYCMLRMGYGRKLIGRGAAERISRQATIKQSLFDRGGRKVPRRVESLISRGVR